MDEITCLGCGTVNHLNPAKHTRRDKYCTGCRAVIHEGTHAYRERKTPELKMSRLHPEMGLRGIRTYMDSIARSNRGVMRHEE